MVFRQVWVAALASSAVMAQNKPSTSLSDVGDIPCIDGTPVCIRVSRLNPTTAEFALLCKDSTGWCGYGTGSQMTGSDMFVVYNVGSNVTLSQRRASGRFLPEAREAQFELVDKGEVGDRFGALFTVDFSKAEGIKPLKLDEEVTTIFAYAQRAPESADTDAEFGLHDNRGTVSINASQGGSGTSAGSSLSTLVTVHGALMITAWAGLTPIGIFIARYLKPRLGVWWFRLHFSLLLLAVILSWAAFWVVFSVSTGRHFTQGVHVWFGIVVLVLAVFQSVLGFVIDKLFDPQRTKVPIWDKLHWFGGRIIAILALVTIILGILLAGAGVVWWVVFAVLAAVLYGAIVAGQFFIGQQHHQE